MVRHEGLGALYVGFTPIAMRQLPYTMTKLVMYEVVVRLTTQSASKLECVLRPDSDGDLFRPYAVVTAGLLAGAAAAVVSHPVPPHAAPPPLHALLMQLLSHKYVAERQPRVSVVPTCAWWYGTSLPLCIAVATHSHRRPPRHRSHTPRPTSHCRPADTHTDHLFHHFRSLGPVP